MTPERIDQLRLLAKCLFGAAALVFVFSLIGAVLIAGSDSNVPLAEDFQRQSRGFVAFAALGGGILGSSVLAGLGGILTVLVEREAANLPTPPAQTTEEPTEPKVKT